MQEIIESNIYVILWLWLNNNSILIKYSKHLYNCLCTYPCSIAHCSLHCCILMLHNWSSLYIALASAAHPLKFAFDIRFCLFAACHFVSSFSFTTRSSSLVHPSLDEERSSSSSLEPLSEKTLVTWNSLHLCWCLLFGCFIPRNHNILEMFASSKSSLEEQELPFCVLCCCCCISWSSSSELPPAAPSSWKKVQAMSLCCKIVMHYSDL